MERVQETVFLPTAVESGPNAGTLSDLIKGLHGLLNRFGYRLNRVLPKDGTEGLHAYTTATKPAASADNAGAIIYVSDGGAGAVFQGSNGSAWVNLG